MDVWILTADAEDQEIVGGWLQSAGLAGANVERFRREGALSSKLSRREGKPVLVVIGPHVSDAAPLSSRLSAEHPTATVTLVGREAAPAGKTDSPPQNGSGNMPAALQAGFLARLAHDIRSPLGLISGALSELEEASGESVTPPQKALLSLADRGLRRLLRLASHLSTVAALESHRLELAPRRSDLRQVLQSAVDSAIAIDGRRSVVVTVEKPDESCEVSCDPERLGAAIAELVSNGIRHARTSVRVTLEPLGETISLRVQDDGDGVPPEAQSHLFQRFVESENRGDTGLGLSIARDIVEASGGRLRIDEGTAEAPKLGGCFVVELTRLAN